MTKKLPVGYSLSLVSSNLSPSAYRSVPESTVTCRSRGWEWGMNVISGLNRTRMINGSGFPGSPTTIAVSTAPARLSVHTNCSGVMLTACAWTSEMAAMPEIAPPSNTGKIRAGLPRPGGAAHLHGMKREGWSHPWRAHVGSGDRRRAADMPYNHEHRHVGEVPSIRIARAIAIDSPLRQAVVVHRLHCSGVMLGGVSAGRGMGHRSAH